MSEFLRNRFGIVSKDNNNPIPSEVQAWLDSLPRGRSTHCRGCGRFVGFESSPPDCPRCYVSPYVESEHASFR